MTLRDITDFFKVLSIMDYVKFFALVALAALGLLLWAYKQKSQVIMNKAQTDAHIITTKSSNTSEIVKAGIVTTAIVVIAKIWK